MRKLGIVLGAVCLVLIGVLVGIALDWSTWLAPGPPSQKTQLLDITNGVSGPTINYEVELWGEANLVVHPGYSIILSRSNGNFGTNMDFGGDSPCFGGDGNPFCLIDGTASPGTYLFSCTTSDSTSYTCPDPGIQQRTSTVGTEALKPIGFIDDLKDVARHAFANKKTALHVEAGNQASQPASGRTTASTRAAAITPQISAYVSCPQNEKIEVDPHNPPGGTNSAITVPKGQTIYWLAHKPLSISFENTAPCSVVPGPTPNSYSCTVSQSTSSTSYFYDVTDTAPTTKPTCASPTVKHEELKVP